MRRRNPISYCSSSQSGEAVSIWRDLHHRLTQLAAVQARSAHAAQLLAQTDPASPDPAHAERLDALWRHTAEEDGILDVCLERLGILIALREAPPDPPAQGRLSKKRRLEVPGPVHVTDHPSTSAAGTELLATDSPASRTSSPAPPPPALLTHTQTRSRAVSRASTPMSDAGAARRMDSGGAARAVFRSDRRVTLRDQLPLLPGRLVAFKRPRKPADGSGSEEWIMAKVVKCICGDKNRYEVEDVDEDGVGGRQTCWNTTLKSIIPLPCPDQSETFPPSALPPGTAVLGLYPETTSFYRGEIKSGPSEKGREYKVFFEDDEQTGPLSVGMEHVVPIS